MSQPLLVLVLTLSLGGCGFATRAEPTAAWRLQARQGDEALVRGEPLRAAEHYGRAERAAARGKDRREARYRRARALWRAGRRDEALTLMRSLFASGRPSGPASVRAARAALDAGLWLVAMQRETEALALWAEALARLASRPTAAAILERAVHLVEQRDGADGALRWLAAHAARTPAGSDLREEALWQRGRLLRAAGRPSEAVEALEALLAAFPPPRGRRWDEALWALADLHEAEERLEEAVEALLRLAEVQEPTWLIGSYTRARMPRAMLRAGELLLRAGRLEAADAVLERLPARFPDSRLRDDALLAAARGWLEAGQTDRACARLAEAAEVQPGGAARRRAERLLARHCR